MTRHSKILIVLAISASLALAGCVDAIDEQIGTSSLDSEDNVAILVTVENAPEGFSHLGLAVDKVFLHDAETPQPDGYFELNARNQADLIVAGAGNTITIANGSVPAGTYDQVLFQLEAVQNHPGTGEEPHEHEDGEADHEHDHASEDAMQMGGTTGPQDLAVNMSATVEADELSEIELFLDGAASTEDGTFQPVFTKLVLRQGGDLVSESTDVGAQIFGEGSTGQGPATSPSTPPPVARMTVFAPSGDKVYEPRFQAEDGDYANTKTSAFQLGADVRFSATESEAVASGATLESYTWDFDDGATAEGLAVSHAWEQPGVYEIALTVTDSNGISDTHMVRVVTLATGWTAELANVTFEDGAEGWETSFSGALVPGGEDVAPELVATTWALAPFGQGSETSYHVGTHFPTEPTVPDELGLLGYTPSAQATLTSPVFEIPEAWSSAGFTVDIAGASEDGFDILTVSYAVDGANTQVGAFSGGSAGPPPSGIGEWTTLGSEDALADATGSTVQFQFTFTSDEIQEVGPGWFVDNLVVGGVDLPLHKAELLDGGAHDGHDHEH